MPIISIRNTEKNKEDGNFERVKAKWFSCAIKLIFKASLIFNSNLELSLSNILKERQLYKSKHVVVEYRCLKLYETCYPFLYLS